jgi:hypothetical protein
MLEGFDRVAIHAAGSAVFARREEHPARTAEVLERFFLG